MKILHINTSDTSGGAAIAAMRLHKAMLASGIDSTFICLNRTINDDERILSVDKKTKLKSRIFDIVKRMLFNKLYLSGKKGLFSNMKQGYKLNKFISLNEYDVIYVHWINGGFLSLKGIDEICKTGKKIFWFMHDMFPITGGCHHSFECNRYTQNCGECPYMKHTGKHDFSYKQLKQKHKILDKYTNLAFIAPSKWLYECTKNSALAKGHSVYHIPNLLDESMFRPLDKMFCREILNLPKDKKIILFGADSALTNPYKGFNYLVESLRILKAKEECNDIELIVFGSSKNIEIEKRLPYDCRFFGYLHDEYTLSLLYNAVNVFCMPSLAEAFGQTALESVFCGTPVVTFSVGGLPDFVSRKTGYLAKYKDTEDFARGIKKCLEKEDFDGQPVLDSCNAENVIKKHKEIWRK